MKRIMKCILILITILLFAVNINAAKLYDMGDPAGGIDVINDWFHAYDMSVGPTGTSVKINAYDLVIAVLFSESITIDVSGNLVATGYISSKVSGEPGREGVYVGNSTDIFITGNEGPANSSADLFFKYSDDEPSDDGIMLYSAPSVNVSLRSWVYFDETTIENNSGTIQVKDDSIGPTQLTDTAITPGEYSNPTVTFNQQGQATSAVNGSSALATEQVGDPAYSDMSTGEWLVATGSGDTFYKSVTGLYNVSAGTYGIDPTPPTMTSATVQTDGDSVIVVFSEALDIGVGGNGGWTLNDPTDVMTYDSGDGSNTYEYLLASTISDTDVPTITYTQPGNGLEDSTGDDLLSLIEQAVINNSTTDTFSDVVFWFNAEANDTADPYTMHSSECSAGDNTGTYIGGDETINGVGALIGSYDFFLDDSVSSNGVDYMYFDVSSNDIAPTEGTYGVMINVDTFGPDYGILAHYVDSSNFWSLRFDGASGDIEVFYKQADDTTFCTWDNVNLSTSTTYYLEIELDPANDQIILKVDGGVTYNESRPVTGMTTVGAGGFLRIGCFTNADDAVYNLDQLAISNSLTRDFNAIKTLTSCPVP